MASRDHFPNIKAHDADRVGVLAGDEACSTLSRSVSASSVSRASQFVSVCSRWASPWRNNSFLSAIAARDYVGPAHTARCADEKQLKLGNPELVRPSVSVFDRESDVVATAIVLAKNEQITDARRPQVAQLNLHRSTVGLRAVFASRLAGHPAIEATPGRESNCRLLVARTARGLPRVVGSP